PVLAAGQEGEGDRVRGEGAVDGHQVTPAEPVPGARGGTLGTAVRHRAACIARVPGQLGSPDDRSCAGYLAARRYVPARGRVKPIAARPEVPEPPPGAGRRLPDEFSRYAGQQRRQHLWNLARARGSARCVTPTNGCAPASSLSARTSWLSGPTPASGRSPRCCRTWGRRPRSSA